MKILKKIEYVFDHTFTKTLNEEINNFFLIFSKMLLKFPFIDFKK